MDGGILDHLPFSVEYNTKSINCDLIKRMDLFFDTKLVLFNKTKW